MKINVYNKNGRRGRNNYKENRLVKELEDFLKEKYKDQPEVLEKFEPATNFEQLKKLHETYLSEDVKFEEIKDKNNNVNKNEMIEKNDFEFEDDKDLFEDISDDDSDNSFVDPFNREEPVLYDYTLEGGMSKDNSNQNSIPRSSFSEPISFEEAFELPEDNPEQVTEESPNNKNVKEKREPKQKREPQEPLNPSFDDMSGSKQKKSTKKFAKYIVEAVCALAEKGFVWYANKDINEAKLTEYELNGEMDLSLLVTLDNGQEATVKQFFSQQCLAAEQLAKFEEEEKKDMSESLAEVFMEKGIAPTTTQEALIVIGGIFVKKGAILLSLKSQTNSLLNQLRIMNENSQNSYREPEPVKYKEPEINETSIDETKESLDIEEYDDLDLTTEDLEIEQVIETKE
jgi:hypothetical protein